MARAPRTGTGRPMPLGPLSRRGFLLTAGGGLAATALVGACSSDDDGATTISEGTQGPPDSTGSGPLSALAAIFDVNAYAVTGSEQRLPVALLDSDGAFSTTGPEELVVAVVADGTQVGEVPVAKHMDQVPIGYYPVRYTFDEPGLYQLRTEVDGSERTADLAVNGPGVVGPLAIGQPMPAVVTPTFDDGQGVVPICTRDPECALHSETLAAALTAGGPVAVLVSTPAYCQIGICGPVLDVLLGIQPDYPGVPLIHAEPFTDAEAVGGPAGATTAPIMDELGMRYEPALWVADASGTVVDRLDFVFDATEMRAALDKVA